MNPNFHFHQEALWAEQVRLNDIAQQVGTPYYLYSQTALIQNWQHFDRAFASQPHQICYAVKANSNLAILNTLAQLNASFDIVSGGELARVIKAGGNPHQVIFSGVGKTIDEMTQALNVGIYCFNVESEDELIKLAQIAQRLNTQAPIALRVNPDVDPMSHPYISTGLKENKFGIAIDDALRLYKTAQAHPHLNIKGIACHIGSQLTQLSPFLDATNRVFDLIDALQQQGIPLTHVDLGGGLGVHYHDEVPPSFEEYAQALLKHFRFPALTLLLEPGRAIVANTGILVSEVLYLKQSGDKHFCILDAGMNDLMRPALYNAWHNIIPLAQTNAPERVYDVVGPVCESGDFLGKQRALKVKPGDYVAILDAGAYGFSMSSNYNTRPRACEVMVKEQTYKIVRQRETIAELFATEQIW